VSTDLIKKEMKRRQQIELDASHAEDNEDADDDDGNVIVVSALDEQTVDDVVEENKIALTEVTESLLEVEHELNQASLNVNQPIVETIEPIQESVEIFEEQSFDQINSRREGPTILLYQGNENVNATATVVPSGDTSNAVNSTRNGDLFTISADFPDVKNISEVIAKRRLKEVYTKCLDLAIENQCTLISFPIIRCESLGSETVKVETVKRNLYTKFALDSIYNHKFSSRPAFPNTITQIMLVASSTKEGKSLKVHAEETYKRLFQGPNESIESYHSRRYRNSKIQKWLKEEKNANTKWGRRKMEKEAENVHFCGCTNEKQCHHRGKKKDRYEKKSSPVKSPVNDISIIHNIFELRPTDLPSS
jgi:hypothetical protein